MHTEYQVSYSFKIINNVIAQQALKKRQLGSACMLLAAQGHD